MADQTETPLAILFADICGSTRLYELLGDSRGRDTVARCLDIMTEATVRNRGRVVKTIGDEIMATFVEADDAAQAAAEMQEDISHRLTVDGQDITIRVGFHFGPVLTEGRDVFGDAVNLAARVAGQAKSGQILTTAPTLRQLSEHWRGATREIDRTALRGRRDEIAIHELMWQREDVTRMATEMRQATQTRSRGRRLVIDYRGQRRELSARQPTLILGRAEQNDVVVRNGLASRLHARIELRKGNFILTDQSINGTYVLGDDGQASYVRRDSIALQGTGLLGLGIEPEPGGPDALRYACLE